MANVDFQINYRLRNVNASILWGVVLLAILCVLVSCGKVIPVSEDTGDDDDDRPGPVFHGEPSVDSGEAFVCDDTCPLTSCPESPSAASGWDYYRSGLAGEASPMIIDGKLEVNFNNGAFRAGVELLRKVNLRGGNISFRISSEDSNPFLHRLFSLSILNSNLGANFTISGSTTLNFNAFLPAIKTSSTQYAASEETYFNLTFNVEEDLEICVYTSDNGDTWIKSICNPLTEQEAEQLGVAFESVSMIIAAGGSNDSASSNLFTIDNIEINNNCCRFCNI